MFLDWFTILYTRLRNTPIRNHKPNTIVQYANEKLGIEYQGFLFVFVRTEMNLIAFLSPSNRVNTQYAALSGAMSPISFHHFRKYKFIIT